MSASDEPPPPRLAVLDVLSAVGPGGGNGVHWSLPADGDLNVNVVHLAPGAAIGAHRNDEVDVVVLVQDGSGTLEVDGHRAALVPHHLALLPRGTERSVTAGPDGLTYVTVHRRRGPLGIGRRPAS